MPYLGFFGMELENNMSCLKPAPSNLPTCKFSGMYYLGIFEQEF